MKQDYFEYKNERNMKHNLFKKIGISKCVDDNYPSWIKK